MTPTAIKRRKAHRTGLTGRGRVRRNLWPFDAFKTSTTYHVKKSRGPATARAGTFKGHKIERRPDGGFVVPSIDRDSVFDDKRQAKRFITAQTKYNPARKNTSYRKVKKQVRKAQKTGALDAGPMFKKWRKVGGVSKAGKKRANPKRVTQREVTAAAADYQRDSQRWGEHNLQTQRSWGRWFDLNKKLEAQKAARPAKENPALRIVAMNEARYNRDVRRLLRDPGQTYAEYKRNYPGRMWMLYRGPDLIKASESKAELKNFARDNSGQKVFGASSWRKTVKKTKTARRKAGMKDWNFPSRQKQLWKATGETPTQHTKRKTRNAGKAAGTLYEWRIVYYGKSGNQTHAVYAPTHAKAKAIAKRDKSHLFDKPRDWHILNIIKQNRGAVRKNAGADPLGQATTVYKKFHGRPPEKILKVNELVYVPDSHLSGIGDLQSICIRHVGGRKKTDLDFGRGVVLCQNLKRTQLYIRGGDQSAPLAVFGIEKPYRDQEILGEALSVDYFTTKDHLAPEDGGTATYRHKFGRKKPTIVYSVPDKKLSFAGGGYTIPDEGIDL